MKKYLFVSLAVMLLVAAASCKKEDNSGKSKYGVDGKTPMPEAVDLGVVVNGKTVKFASFNLGASKEYEYGDFFAWGETLAKTSFGWESYTYANGSLDKLIKYCPKGKTAKWDMTAKPEGPDGETSILPTDDAAHVKLGGKWRIPTLEDIQALVALKNDAANYLWEYGVLATDADGNEMKDAKGNVLRGVRITRKSTGAKLYIPLPGYYAYDETYGGFPGQHGAYWCSLLDKENPDTAFYMIFTTTNADVLNTVGLSRCCGLPIRPVCD